MSNSLSDGSTQRDPSTLDSINMRTFSLLAGLLVSYALAACSAVDSATLNSMTESEVAIQSGSTVGQTFVAENAGLDGLLVYLDPEGNLSGEVRLHLRSDSQSSSDISQSVISADQITQAGSYLFQFDAQSDSFRKYYYAFLEYEGTGLIWVGNAQAASYLDGALYVDHRPIDLQMGFQLTYQLGFRALGFLRELLYWLVILLVAIFLFVVPGYAILIRLWPASGELDFMSSVGIAAGLSLALYPLLFLWTDVFNLHLGRAYAWLPATGGLLYLLWKWKPWKSVARFRDKLLAFTRSDDLWPGIVLLLTVGSIVFVRFYMIRGIDAPMWGDSVQHTMIAQLLVNNGGLFNSWAPLAELESLTYHFGFHSHVAVFHWITGLDLPSATLWTGQILNILAVVSLYALVRKAGGSRWGGITTIFIAGLLTSMPNFYTNWGRYTQLAGQVILIAVVILLWTSFTSPKRNYAIRTAAILALGGLGLTHYRILLFAMLFIASFAIFRLQKDTFLPYMKSVIFIGIGFSLITLPWLLRTITSRISLTFFQYLSTPTNQTTDWVQQYNAIPSLSSFLPTALWIATVFSILWGIWRKRQGILILSSWWLLLLFATNPQWINLPGEGIISNFALLIAMYIFSAIVIGIMLGDVASSLIYRPKPLIILLIVSAGIWAGRVRLQDLNPFQHALVSRPDLRAASWIKKNTSTSANFLVHAFFAYDGISIVGSDGGWWLRSLADRNSTLPPLSYSSEDGPRPDYRQWVNALQIEINAKGIDHPDVLALIDERDISHVYIGQRRGRVNYGGVDQFPPEKLIKSKNFQPIYNEDLVWIFEIKK